MERYLNMIKVNFKISILPFLIICVIMCLVSPFFMGVECIDEFNVAKIVEIYLSLFGVLLIIPIFSPEQDKNIRDVVATKKTTIRSIYILRFSMAFILIILLSMIYLLFLKNNECEFDFIKLWFSNIANAVFLGGVGLILYAISDNMIVGYMTSIFYYILNFGAGKRILGNYYLFSMSIGVFANKWWLFITGAILIILAIIIKVKENRRWLIL